MNAETGAAGAAAPDAGVRVSIRNKKGLHARAAASFVKHADQFDAEIIVRKGDMVAPGRSIMGLMMLGAGTGTVIEITATGPEAPAAVATLARLVEDGFDED